MKDLRRLRQKVDKIDRELIAVLAKRFEVTREIGRYKKEKKMSPRNKRREEEIFKKIRSWNKNKKLDEKFLKKIFNLIIEKSIEEHQKIFSSSRNKN